ncbi:MAG: hypothetical protein JSW03_09690 [Candidatus Eiseniibacteriota bacterium]|nr:MAG: hypothetical protein JSW03_09690 [Candidatus Eisenbacteria bacterium]
MPRGEIVERVKTYKGTAMLLFALALTFPASAIAIWQDSGNPICIAGGWQYAPVIAFDGAGGAIIAWKDERSGTKVYAQRVDADGNELWASCGVKISGSVDIWGLGGLEIVSDGSGGAIVVWERPGDIHAQRIDGSANLLWGVDGVAVCMAPGNQFSPQLVSDDAGGAIIVWGDGRGSDEDVYAQRVNGSGTPLWTTNGVVICNAAFDQQCIDIAPDDFGGAVITWEDMRNGGNFHAYTQRVDGDGNLLWIPNGVYLSNLADDNWSPRIASDGAGGAIIVWKQETGYSSTAIHGQHVDASGDTTWGPSGIPIASACCRLFEPRLVPDGSGGAFVTWVSYYTGPTDELNIYAQRVDAAGSHLWTPGGVVISAAPVSQNLPRIIRDSEGGAIITWQDYRSGDNSDIYAQRRDASGVRLWEVNGQAICTAAGQQEEPRLTSDGAGGAMIVWRDTRGANPYNVYAQRIEADGSFVGVGETVQRPAAVSALEQNCPNPFNPLTTIRFSLPEPGRVVLSILDIEGRAIRTLVEGWRKPQRYEVAWDGRDDAGRAVASGVYLYRLEASGHNETKKMVLLR